MTIKPPRLRKGTVPITVSHPQVVSEFDAIRNGFTAEHVGKGFGKVWWKCTAGHSWKAAVYNRVRGQGCPYCIGRKVLPETSLAGRYPNIVEQWSAKNRHAPDQVWYASQQQFWWQCPAQHHEHRTSIAYRLQNGCPYCSDTTFLAGWNDLATRNPEIAAEYCTVKNPLPADQMFYRSQSSVWWNCSTCQHSFKTRVARRTVEQRQCPACAGNVIVDGLNDLSTFAPYLVPYYDAQRTGRAVDTVGKGRDVWWKCGSGHSFEASPYLLMFRDPELVCRVCYPQSSLEYAVLEELMHILPEDVNISRNSRSLIPPYEVDIVVPAFLLAIEVNGSYWHSEEHIQQRHGMSAKAYHKMKEERCAAVGYRLLHVWEDEWSTSRAQVMDRIAQALSVSLQQ